MATVKTRLTIKRLHPLFVAEVTGIDLTRPIPREEFPTIWDAFNEHQIIVFRNQAFDDESQIAFSQNFGELEMMVAHPGNDWNPGHISVMTNLGKDGKMLPLDHPAMIHRERNGAWLDKIQYTRKLHRTTITGKAPDSAFASMPEARAA